MSEIGCESMLLFIKCLPRLFRQASKDMRRHFALFFSSTLSILIALLISMLMMILTANVTHFTQNIEQQLVIQVSINPTLSQEEMDSLEEKLGTMKDVSSVYFSDKDEEMEQLIEDYGKTFEQYAGDKNPLYDVFILELEDTTKIDEVTRQVNQMDGVIEATYGTGAVNTMVHLFSALRYGGVVFVVLMILLSIFLIRNAIRTTIQLRKEEIQIMRQVGAFNWYITFPCMLQGLLSGCLGAVIPCLLCLFGYSALYQSLDGIFMSDMFVLVKPFPFTLYVCALLAGIGILVGMSGSYLASRKYLRWTR